MKNSKFVVLFTAIAAAIVSIPAICSSVETQTPGEQRIRIGVFNTRAVAIAYTRSKEFSAKIEKMLNQANEAKTNGNDKVYKKIEAELKMEQEKMQWQVFSNARIDDILTKVRPSYESIARKANVDAISDNIVYNDPKVELVDVTDLIAEQFGANEVTKQKMQEIIKKPPATFEQMKEAQEQQKLKKE